VGAASGVLVIGHGTADPVGAGECRQIAAAVAGLLPDAAVELGFLEVIAPSIEQAVARLAARGCRQVVAAPLLLFAAGHATRDVPEAVAAAAAAHGIEIRQAAAFGTVAEIVEASRVRRRQALAGRGEIPPGETVLVMVGRGSSDPTALAQLREFAAATLDGDAAFAPVRVEYGFVAAARPSLDDALAAAADLRRGAVRRIVVQPHLLFRGHVEDQVADAVAAAQVRRPDLDWIQVARLGADPLVAGGLVRRVTEIAAAESLSRHG